MFYNAGVVTRDRRTGSRNALSYINDNITYKSNHLKISNKFLSYK
jgi:hypothetical protein